MSYFKRSRMRSQPSTRSMCSCRILRALVCSRTWSRDIGRTKRFHLLLLAEARLNIPRLVWESTHVTWIGIDFVIHSTSYESICSVLILKRIFWFFPRVGASDLSTWECRYWSEVRQNHHLGSWGSRAFGSMTTVCRRTHQRLANLAKRDN